jgi:hypothetical protein
LVGELGIGKDLAQVSGTGDFFGDQVPASLPLANFDGLWGGDSQLAHVFEGLEFPSGTLPIHKAT